MTTMTTECVYHVPTRPYTPIDALNRRAAATGSPGYASMASHADYNGHAIRVWWNDYKGYYIAEYFWAGRRVLAHGELSRCVEAALREHNRGSLGSRVAVFLREDDDEALLFCSNHRDLIPGEESKEPSWYTWRHVCAARSARDYANPGMMVMIFDWDLMQDAGTEQEYEEALRAKYGRVFQ